MSPDTSLSWDVSVSASPYTQGWKTTPLVIPVDQSGTAALADGLSVGERIEGPEKPGGSSLSRRSPSKKGSQVTTVRSPDVSTLLKVVTWVSICSPWQAIAVAIAGLRSVEVLHLADQLHLSAGASYGRSSGRSAWLTRLTASPGLSSSADADLSAGGNAALAAPLLPGSLKAGRAGRTARLTRSCKSS
jgi:hypothetical protein